MKTVTVLGVDLAKSVFQLHGVNGHGKAVFKRRVSRGELRKVVANLTPCLIGMEACGGSSYWAHQLQAMGHKEKLMPPQYVKPYVKTNKNDASDAEAICEAVTRPNMRFSSVKSQGQQ